MPITMKDQAWVWKEYNRQLWVVDCPDCGQLSVPSAIDRAKAEHLANLHNARNHGGGHDAD